LIDWQHSNLDVNALSAQFEDERRRELKHVVRLCENKGPEESGLREKDVT
jgi:hypothetical protein